METSSHSNSHTGRKGELRTVTKERKQGRKEEEEISTERTNPVYLHHTAMFSNDSINHHFILIKTSGDWNIDPCGEGKHPLGWLQQSVDSITHPCFFPPIFISWISIIIVTKEGCCLHTFSYPVFVQASNLHTIAGDWWHVKVKAAISLQQPRRNNINTNINFQLNCQCIAFCLPTDRLFIAMLRRDCVCSSHTFVHQFLTDSRYAQWERVCFDDKAQGISMKFKNVPYALDRVHQEVFRPIYLLHLSVSHPSISADDKGWLARTLGSVKLLFKTFLRFDYGLRSETTIIRSPNNQLI